MKRKVLLLGCGHKEKPLCYFVEGSFTDWNKGAEVVRVDMNPDVAPDHVLDINERPLPFRDNEFDEIHAYEVLEHIGKQGDWKAFFDEFSEYHRILKDGGDMIFSCPHPDSKWVWADPSHVREVSPRLIVFLSQSHYEQCGKDSPCSDYRFYYKANFDNIVYAEQRNKGEPVSIVYRITARKGESNE